jgi:hypothetical protein
MSLLNCPDCGNQVSSDAAACPKCGRLQLGGAKRYRMLLVGLVVGVVGVLNAFYVHRGTVASGRAFSGKAVHSGQKERIAYFYALRADCMSEGYPEIVVVRPPDKGRVSTEEGKAYPQYTRDNTRFDCDKNLTEAILVYYQSEPSFHGRDSVTIMIRFPDSNARTEFYTIDVM